MPSAIRRPWWVSERTSPTLPTTWAATTSAPPPAWRAWPSPPYGIWFWRVRWWSTARGATRARGTESYGPVRACLRPWKPGTSSHRARTDPRNVYAATKLAQEHLAAAWARATGGRVAAQRYHNVYGPGMPRDTPYAGVASLFRSALARGEAPRVFEDGGQRRDFVHVRDIADANLAALDGRRELPEGGLRAYNVGSGQPQTVGEMAAAPAPAYGGPEPVVTGEYRLGDVRHITASSQRLRDELGWKPQVEFEHGMAEFATAELRAG
ncbi:NAD-dependent epimerase/dehydratase family protein [Streptomyces griseorubiginosus]|uniref:NAD-dependent epimerase/dehydratase family protein n=1 Tax=Streptomyces griseorubiginosus TaxID=67304 RepID=UPI003677823B